VKLQKHHLWIRLGCGTYSTGGRIMFRKEFCQVHPDTHGRGSLLESSKCCLRLQAGIRNQCEGRSRGILDGPLRWMQWFRSCSVCR
jgi:hypothetical protein